MYWFKPPPTAPWKYSNIFEKKYVLLKYTQQANNTGKILERIDYF